MGSELEQLRDETERLSAALSRIAGEVGAVNADPESCIAAIRRMKRETLQVTKSLAPARRTLYHITSRDNLLSIRQNGLTCALGVRSQADGFTVPMIHCFRDKVDVEEAIAGWVLDVFDHDGGFVILEFTSHGLATSGRNGPVLLEEVPFSAITVYDECFCPEDLTPVEDGTGRVGLEEAVVWLGENGVSVWRDGSRLNADIHDDFTTLRIEGERVYMHEVESAQRTFQERRRAYLSVCGLEGV